MLASSNLAVFAGLTYCRPVDHIVDGEDYVVHGVVLCINSTWITTASEAKEANDKDKPCWEGNQMDPGEVGAWDVFKAAPHHDTRSTNDQEEVKDLFKVQSMLWLAYKAREFAVGPQDALA
jgi:hypothetical protein